jgi:hypothetical protein
VEAVKFRAGDLEFNATVAESSDFPSPQTGDPLRALTIQFRAQKDAMHEQALVQAELCQTGGLFSVSDSDVAELEWRVRERNSSYVGSEPWGINHHVWRIEQVERLAIEQLVLGQIELEPYDYTEQVADDGVVRLAARALISEADLTTLSALTGPLDVVRTGISATPRRMHVSYVWGERPEGPAVVVQCEDVREPRLTLQGFNGPAGNDLADLIEVLAASGVLEHADLETLRSRRHAARRVANVDGWGL